MGDDDPITCNVCETEMEFAFEEQRDDIVCESCRRGDETDDRSLEEVLDDIEGGS